MGANRSGERRKLRMKRSKRNLVTQEKAAEANRVKHGTPKAVRDLSKARSELSARRLENSRLDDDIDKGK